MLEKNNKTHAVLWWVESSSGVLWPILWWLTVPAGRLIWWRSSLDVAGETGDNLDAKSWWWCINRWFSLGEFSLLLYWSLPCSISSAAAAAAAAAVPSKETWPLIHPVRVKNMTCFDFFFSLFSSFFSFFFVQVLNGRFAIREICNLGLAARIDSSWMCQIMGVDLLDTAAFQCMIENEGRCLLWMMKARS